MNSPRARLVGGIALVVIILSIGAFAWRPHAKTNPPTAQQQDRSQNISTATDESSDSKTPPQDKPQGDGFVPKNKQATKPDAKNRSPRKDRIQRRLDQALTAGRISRAQADSIQKKYQELADFRKQLGTLSATDRLTRRNTKRNELLKWARENNLPKDLVISLV